MESKTLIAVFICLMFALLICLSVLFHHIFKTTISKKYGAYYRWIVGRKIGSEPDSNFRRYLTIAICILSYGFIVIAIGQYAFSHYPEANQDKSYLGAIMALIPLGYFIYVVLLTPFRTSKDFTVNPIRLAHNTMVSALGIICFFAVFYSVHGISKDGIICEFPVPIAETMYFSTVTFSTLGYGDLAPCQGLGRFMAGFQAVIGNIHLGVFVAAIFLAARNDSAS